MSELEDVHQLLKRARAHMADHGFTKYTLQDEHGGVCLRGALIIAESGTGSLWSWPVNPLVATCERVMGFPNDPLAVPSWNNADERTKQDVLARFDEAIERTRPKESPAYGESSPESHGQGSHGQGSHEGSHEESHDRDLELVS